MKGGITSGVVYPRLISRLSATYRFKNIGGTSAGAIAAAGAAAAEFGRLGGNTRGFEELAQLPETLGKTAPKARGSRLRHLFQPSKALSRHFDVLLAALNQPGKMALAVNALGTLLLRYWALAWIVAVMTLAIATALIRSAGPMPWPSALWMSLGGSALWLAAGWLLAWRPARVSNQAPSTGRMVGCGLVSVLAGIAALALLSGQPWATSSWVSFTLAGLAWALVLPLGFGLALVLCAWRFGQTLLAGLHQNFWGICSGRTQEGQPVDGLTDWLTGYFNALAGLHASARPLTLGDLWDGVRHADDDQAPKDDIPPRRRCINLEVMTTAVSRRMCHAIPFKQGAPAYYYDADEWSRIFPDTVMNWLKTTSLRARPEDITNEVTTKAGRTLYRLPCNSHLPVVVLVRMSLSFPVLLSAVPMYAVDYSGKQAQAHAKRVWFSDGGIASNMPLHFFDEVLPQHPTFAVNLKDEDVLDHPIGDGPFNCSTDKNRVYLPEDGKGGLQQFWASPDDSPAGLVGFLWNIVNTMQSWRDEIQLPMPGYRDRIVQIAQKAKEGGLNLDMPSGHISALAQAGDCAAQRLVDRFAVTGQTAPNGWEVHRSIRLKTFLALAEDLVKHPSLSDPEWETILRGSGLGYTAAEKQRAIDIYIGLRNIGSQAQVGTTLATKAPKPRPVLRIVPRI